MIAKRKGPGTRVQGSGFGEQEKVLAISTGAVTAHVLIQRDRKDWQAGFTIAGPTFGHSTMAMGGFASRHNALVGGVNQIEHYLNKLGCTTHVGCKARDRAVKAISAFRTRVISESLKSAKSVDQSSVDRSSTALAVVPAGSDVIDLTPLTKTEEKQLARLEKVVAEGAAAFVAVGSALRQIQESRLYRGAFATFEEYLGAKWGISRSDAYRQIAAAQKAEEAAPIAAKLRLQLTSESHFRPVAKLERPDLEQVLKAVARRCKPDCNGDRRPTAALIAETAREILTPPEDLERQREAQRERDRERGRKQRATAAAETVEVQDPDRIPFLAPGPGPAETTMRQHLAGAWNGRNVEYAPQLHAVAATVRECFGEFPAHKHFALDLFELLHDLTTEVAAEGNLDLILSRSAKPRAVKA